MLFLTLENRWQARKAKASAFVAAMALPLTFTASYEAGLSRSGVNRRLGRYRRSSDALRRRRFA